MSPSIITGEQKRPNIVVIDKQRSWVFVLELTVGFETRIKDNAYLNIFYIRLRLYLSIVMKYLSEADCDGVLPLTDDVMRQLQEKHPEAQEAKLGSLLFGPFEEVPDSLYQQIDGEMIREMALQTKGSGGPSGVDANGFNRIFACKSFKKSGVNLCETPTGLYLLTKVCAGLKSGILCPCMSTYAINTYREPARLFISGGGELKSTEGTTEGDPLAMGILLTTRGQKHLGAALGSMAFLEEYLNGKVEDWVSQIVKLAEFAASHPQACYAVFSFGLRHRWTYFLRTLPDIEDLLEPLERAIANVLIPSITDHHCTKSERHLLALPVRMGGLGLINLRQDTAL
ncbi:Hypothetical predicted protein, partial [Paramuricea clavata]